MVFAWLSTILLLPFTVTVVIPVLLLWMSGFSHGFSSLFTHVAGALLLVAGLMLAIWTMGLFQKLGKGTAAPWNPPIHFVVRGPYRYVRNPMIIGVLMILAAEALLLGSWIVAIWAGFFFSANHFYYFPKVEEPRLLERFGEEYAAYTNHVNRWIPKFPAFRKQ